MRNKLSAILRPILFWRRKAARTPRTCPHCGGRRGWAQVVHLRRLEMGSWGRGATATSQSVTWRSSLVSCVECRRKLACEKAMGLVDGDGQPRRSSTRSQPEAGPKGAAEAAASLEASEPLVQNLDDFPPQGRPEPAADQEAASGGAAHPTEAVCHPEPPEEDFTPTS